jgi:hypothetical protein
MKKYHYKLNKKLVLQFNFMKAFMKYVNKKKTWFFSLYRIFYLKEREHRPRTVLNQLYNYQGGIVPNAAEADKSSANQRVC